MMNRIRSSLTRARTAVLYSKAWLNRTRLRKARLVAITGSAGKTSTKELAAAVLAEFGACDSTKASENEQEPVARLLTDLKRDTRFCVAEMAAYKPGAMKLTVGMARPDVGVLTIIGRDHYSAFRSLEAIAEEKSKVITMLPSSGVAVVNLDDPLVASIGAKAPCRVIGIGRSDDATVQLLAARSIWPEPLTLDVRISGTVYTIRTQLHGEYLALSVLATLGIVLALELPLEPAIEALQRVLPPDGRMQHVASTDGVDFIRDDFKAPHWSFQAPLDFLGAALAKRKIAVVGTVSDSPDSPSKRYLRIARDVRKVADLAVFVGKDANKALKARSSAEDGSIQAFLTVREANEYLKRTLQRGDLVLLKGTQKQDHLVRLIIDRESAVSCWRDSCGRQKTCSVCRWLFDPSLEQATDETDVLSPIGESADSGFRVVAGLGNPGKRYEGTPHNSGYMVLDQLATLLHADWVAQPEGQVCEVDVGGARVMLLKPDSLMNASGGRVLPFLARIGASAASLTVVYDELDVPLGDARWKHGGGDGGHKGVRSVIEALKTEEFARLRVGIRSRAGASRGRDAVLERYSSAELKELERAASLAAHMLLRSLRDSSPESDKASRATTEVEPSSVRPTNRID